MTQATGALVQRAIKLALQPLVNQMAMMGLVSIPGMMTGQILAGQSTTEVGEGWPSPSCIHTIAWPAATHVDTQLASLAVRCCWRSVRCRVPRPALRPCPCAHVHCNHRPHATRS
jgi:hypothetical protein